MEKWGRKDVDATKKVVAPGASGAAARKPREGTDKRKAARDESGLLHDDKDPFVVALEAEMATGSLTAEVILRKAEAVRSRKWEKSAVHGHLEKLAACAATVSQSAHLEMLNLVISSYFEAQSGVLSCLTVSNWSKVHDRVAHVLDELPQFDALGGKTEADERLGKRARSSLCAFLVRLDAEHLKALQLTEAYSSAAREIYAQVVSLWSLLWRGMLYFEGRGESQSAETATLALALSTHFHAYTDAQAAQFWSLVRDHVKERSCPKPEGEPTAILDALVDRVLKCPPLQEREETLTNQTRALLHRIVNRCIHDRFFEAQNAIRYQNLHDLSMQQAVGSQVLHNRCLVQYALCAFRVGMYQETFQVLEQFMSLNMSLNRLRELLAQGVSAVKQSDRPKTAEVELEERKRMVPFLHHINLDLVESVYNICAMLEEVPQLVSNSPTQKRRTASRFRKLLDGHDRHHHGPPENSREAVLAASSALMQGSWRQCADLILGLKIWDMPCADDVKQRLVHRIKKEAARVYMIQYWGQYTSVSLDVIAGMFELDDETVHAILSKMMLSEELPAMWDETSRICILSRAEATPLQAISLRLTEKLLQASDHIDSLVGFRGSKSMYSKEGARHQQPRGGDSRARRAPSPTYRPPRTAFRRPRQPVS